MLNDPPMVLTVLVLKEKIKALELEDGPTFAKVDVKTVDMHNF